MNGTLFRKVRTNLLNLLFPWENACAHCRRSLKSLERGLCRYCEEELAQCILTPLEAVSAHEPLQVCISAFAYENVARKLIHQLKYQNNATVAPLLGLHMCAALLNAPVTRDWDAVVPVPLHPSRQKRRGYNQSQLLAQEIAHCYGFCLRTDLLLRTKASESQTTRSAEDRRAAMEGAFAAAPQASGLRILLVDDVLTTGATATACAKALLDAGALQVTLITACQA